MSTPDQLESEIGTTRDSLSKDVARLNERVSPGRFVGTRTDRIKSSASSIKDKLMGATDGAGQAAAGKLGSAVGSVHDSTNAAAAKLSDAGGGAEALRGQTQGNPVAAGLIAFGVGWLVSSLVPVSQAEQNAAKRIEENASGVTESLTGSAKEIAGNLQEPLQNSANALKETAGDAVNTTTEHAKSAASDVQDKAQNTAKSTASDLQDKAQNTVAEQQNRSR